MVAATKKRQGLALVKPTLGSFSKVQDCKSSRLQELKRIDWELAATCWNSPSVAVFGTRFFVVRGSLGGNGQNKEGADQADVGAEGFMPGKCELTGRSQRVAASLREGCESRTGHNAEECRRMGAAAKRRDGKCEQLTGPRYFGHVGDNDEQEQAFGEACDVAPDRQRRP